MPLFGDTRGIGGAHITAAAMEVVDGEITSLALDAIFNAANESLLGVDGACIA
jgi:O-acetyl-ADP-ribose deacetylase (regulator of RNase III)